MTLARIGTKGEEMNAIELELYSACLEIAGKAQMYVIAGAKVDPDKMQAVHSLMGQAVKVLEN